MDLQLRHQVEDLSFTERFKKHMKEKGYWFSAAGAVGGVWSIVEDVFSSGSFSAEIIVRKFVKSALGTVSVANFVAAVVASIMQTANALGYRKQMMTEIQSLGILLGLPQSDIWEIDSIVKSKGWL